MAQQSRDEDEVVSSLVVEILDGAMPCQESELGSCLCCDGPVDAELNVVSELVVEKQERPVLEVLQEILASSEVPASARLCRDCLAKVLRYHQLREALTELQGEMQREFSEATDSRRRRSAEMPHREAEPELDLALPPSPSPPLPSPPPPSPPPPRLPPPPRPQRQAETEERAAGQLTEAVQPAGGSQQQPEINISIKVLQPPPADQTSSAEHSARSVAARPCFVCPEPDCGRSFPSPGLLADHTESCHGPPGLPCPECRLVAESQQQLEEHVAAVHKAGEAQYRCDECSERFHLESELKEHRHSLHDGFRKCRQCRRVFRSQHAYLEHQVKHSGQNMIECPVCSEKFRRRVCLAKHMKVHRKHGSVLPCDQCREKFSTIGRLRTHQKQRHDVQQPWRCESEGCNKSFRSRAALEVHSVNHTGQRPFSCSVCNKRFVTKHRMQAHHRVHTGERPFQCAMCGRQFRHKSNLYQHTALAHKTERHYRCAICHRAFRRPRQLETHRAACHPSHELAAAAAPAPAAAGTAATAAAAAVAVAGTAAAAPAAGTSTSVTAAARPLTAARRPPVTKQYKCSICSRAFLRVDNLRTHMFIHTEKKPYECRECGVGFLRRLQLQEHLQTAGHGEGLSDYIINQAVFVMDAAPGVGHGASVRLISAGQDQMFNVLESSEPQLDTGGESVAQIVFKTNTPDTTVDSSKVIPQEEQIIFKAFSPRTDLGSPSVATVRNDHQIIFKDSPRVDLGSPEIVRLDDQQIIFKEDSPRVGLDSSVSGRQDDQTAGRWQ